jgi:hypothetical protein
MGSCFAAEIGRRMTEGGLDAVVNPFGILYNPVSIGSGLRRLMDEKLYEADDLCLHRGLFHSFDHHGSFSRPCLQEALELINSRLRDGAGRLRSATRIVITWGNAVVFRRRDNDTVAGNCHKMPAGDFRRERLSVSDIVSLWQPLLQDLRAINPDARLILTVSPVRYLADGAHESNLAKSALLLAADELEREFDGFATYFPAYEIMLDELRDYRFYAPDMLHPSVQAIDYIWERFRDTYFAEEDRQLFREWEQIKKALLHVPTNVDGADYRRFIERTLQKVEEISRKFPYFDTSSERTLLHTIINQ